MADMILPPSDGVMTPMDELEAMVPATAARTKLGTLRVRRAYKGEGRPAYVPTPQQRQFVERWRATGIAPDDIARQLEISPATLRKYFDVELAHGQEKIVGQMGAQVVKQGLAGNINAAKFYLANFGGGRWTDKSKVELSGPNGTALAPPNLVISFPLLPAKDASGT